MFVIMIEQANDRRQIKPHAHRKVLSRAMRSITYSASDLMKTKPKSWNTKLMFIDIDNHPQLLRIEAERRRPRIVTAANDGRGGIARVQPFAHLRFGVATQGHTSGNDTLHVVRVVRLQHLEFGLNATRVALDTVVGCDGAQCAGAAERLHNVVGDVVFRFALGKHLLGFGFDFFLVARCGHGDGNQAGE